MVMRHRKVAIYLRVSTKSQSTDLQRQHILEYIQARGWELVETYEDKASGTSNNRDGLQRLMLASRRGKFNTIVCWKLDRFFRSLKDLVSTLQELSELNIEFVSVRDQIDMTTSTGRLLTHLLAAFAEFEANLIKERVNAGIERAKKRGTKLGRPPAIDVERVVLLRKRGLSLSQIAKQVGCTKSAVSKLLKKHRVEKG